jgi:hypothetical protein
MKLTGLMGLICLGLSLVLLATFVIEERPAVESIDADGNATTAYLGHGQAHPELETLLIGGPGAERGQHIWVLALLFGALQIAFFVCCMLLGVRRNGVIGPAGKFIIGGGAIYLLIFAALMFSYRSYMNADPLDLVGSLPPPTAWMLYAMWTVPLLFLLVFVLGFRRFVWDDDNDRILAEIVAAKRAGETAADEHPGGTG